MAAPRPTPCTGRTTREFLGARCGDRGRERKPGRRIERGHERLAGPHDRADVTLRERGSVDDLVAALDDFTRGRDDFVAGRDEVVVGAGDVVIVADEIVAGLDEIAGGADEVVAGPDDLVAGADEIVMEG